ncbi:hypothetical protein CFOL_v3_20610 [Cephalotus follicularis]|uniref:Uncharacterized protein n=1 Tax=Cephalotus follicularis TaxID=3775 RepID=A0A1Q3CAK6_CEPFO|nr:hypothetical protein CFOL_v3_20610 [Cephalotus follicularis]
MASKPENIFKTKASYSETFNTARQLSPTITNENIYAPIPAESLTTIYSQVAPTISPTNPSQKFKTTTKHVKNPHSEYLFCIEPEFAKNCKTPLEITRKAFYKDWHFYNSDPQKTQTFFEYILVDTDSIKINPKTDPKNPCLITRTSVFIQKILTIQEWGQSPQLYKQFSSPFIPSAYNYFDYIDAWKYAFLFQNIQNRHSWFFCFDKTFNIDQTIPYWFIHQWWIYYGPHKDILPPTIVEALLTFHKHTENIKLCPTMLRFFIYCKLSWIMYWDYSIEQTEDILPTLYRNFWTKWWNNYDLSKCTSHTILQSLQDKIKQSQQFALTKSQIQTAIASSSSKQELQEQIKKLQEALANIPDSDSDKEDIESQVLVNLGDDEDFLPIVSHRRKGKEKITKTGKKNHWLATTYS